MLLDEASNSFISSWTVLLFRLLKGEAKNSFLPAASVLLLAYLRMLIDETNSFF